MNEHSLIGKILCAVGLAAALGWVLSSVFGGVLANSAATELQILGVKAVAGLIGVAIGGWLGWANSQLILTGTIYMTIYNVLFGWL